MEQKTIVSHKISDESIEILSLDVLKFYYDAVQKRMSDYHQQARDTTERGYKIIGIYATILIALCAYLYANWEPNGIYFSILSLLVGTAISAMCMLVVLLPRDYMPLGRTISELQPNEYASSFEKVHSNMQMKCILRDQIDMLEDSIQWQGEHNIRRTRLFKFSLRSIMTGIFISIIIYLTSISF